MTTAVLLMAYGSPSSPEEVGPYLQDIRGGRAPGAQAVAELTERYRAIGGASPLREITLRQAAAVEEALNHEEPGAFRTYVGMKHWHPFVREAVERIAADGAETVAGLVLAPHYARMSIGGYESRVLAAREEMGASFDLRMVRSWYDDPGFVSFAAGALRATLEGWDPADPATRVVFTAHSLPERILAEGDPYREQLLESARLVAEAAGAPHWEFAFQSASATGEPWLGPDVLERLDTFAADGGRQVVIHPIGFVADHLEVLYDLDVECAGRAAELGLELRRTRSPNDDPRFAGVLAEIVRRALRESR